MSRWSALHVLASARARSRASERSYTLSGGLCGNACVCVCVNERMNWFPPLDVMSLCYSSCGCSGARKRAISDSDSRVPILQRSAYRAEDTLSRSVPRPRSLRTHQHTCTTYTRSPRLRRTRAWRFFPPKYLSLPPSPFASTYERTDFSL